MNQIMNRHHQETLAHDSQVNCPIYGKIAEQHKVGMGVSLKRFDGVT